MHKIFKADLAYMLDYTRDLFDKIKGERIFITGGTGFLGCWFLESFLWANDNLNLKSKVVVLTRNKEAFEKKAPHLAFHPAVTLHLGNMEDFVFPPGEFSYVIHAASEVRNATLIDDNQLTKTMIAGTKRTLDFAVNAKASNFLFTSSGAVYGKQPASLSHISENYLLEQFASIQRDYYGQGKFLSESLCVKYANDCNLKIKIARCFALVGPYLPLHTHFAIGNFILNGLRGEPIHIKSDGTTCRSYLYAADLTIWLWHILFCGQSCQTYNVGSEKSVSIAELADVVASCFVPRLPIIIDKKPEVGKVPERYVPSVLRIKRELGLEQKIDLLEGIIKTKNWYQANMSNLTT